MCVLCLYTEFTQLLNNVQIEFTSEVINEQQN